MSCRHICGFSVRTSIRHHFSLAPLQQQVRDDYPFNLFIIENNCQYLLRQNSNTLSILYFLLYLFSTVFSSLSLDWTVVNLRCRKTSKHWIIFKLIYKFCSIYFFIFPLMVTITNTALLFAVLPDHNFPVVQNLHALTFPIKVVFTS